MLLRSHRPFALVKSNDTQSNDGSLQHNALHSSTVWPLTRLVLCPFSAWSAVCTKVHAAPGTSRPTTQAGSLTLLDRKRLELARALASDPKLLLLDEIAGGLTDEESKDLVALVRRIRDRGVTIVWIEHVLHALLAVADRLMVLNFGEKIAEGAPQQVINDPEVKRVYMGIEA